jgi:putative tryptophan/tyrosine transport system substrate-binding protein
MMDRRTFGLAVGATALWSESARCQAKGIIGYLHPVTIDPGHVTFKILQSAWQRLGYVDGTSLLARSADGHLDSLAGLTEDLIRQGAGVLIVVGAEAVRAAALTTTKLPIVAIDMETDPVEAGLIASYARPGGNVTGLFVDLPSLASKWIELIREAVPGLERVVLGWHVATGRAQLDVALAVAKAANLETQVVAIDVSDDFDAKFAGLASQTKSGFVQLTMAGLTSVGQNYTAAAQRHQLPMITHLRALAQQGALMSYGPMQEAYFGRAVEMADKILGGTNVSETPIERPTRFELVVNLKTAKALAITIPPTILIRADEVIE